MRLTVAGSNATSIGLGIDNSDASGTLDLVALGSGYSAHGASAGEVWFYSPDNINIGGATGNTNNIKFLGGGSERMRIDSSGLVLLHTTSDGGVGNTFKDTGQQRMAMSGTSAFQIVQFANGNGQVGTIVLSGSSTAFNTSSDYRLKENVITEWDATTRLKQLKPSRFNFKTDKDTTLDGFLAHEVSDIVPEAISGEKDAVDKDGKIEPQAIDQSKLVPLLTKALQEAVAKIETLEAKVTALEAK
jgi:hypothetical protein